MTAMQGVPRWFWVVAVLLVLWNLIGVAAFVGDLLTTPEMRARSMYAYDQHLYAARPGWMLVAYAVATVAGTVGSIALLLRRGC
jgi:hypothetical protein